ncbi:MAG: class I SAM-dependent methyltransferase [Terriglobales bacterium]
MSKSKSLRPELDSVIDAAWQRAKDIAGFLAEDEFRALGMLAACAPGNGVIVEIGSFKGKSTLALAAVAAEYRLGAVVSIDPHCSPSVTDPDFHGHSSSLEDFRANLRAAGLEHQVEVHPAFSGDVAKEWSRPIRMLWIDGDHTYKGAKQDFDLFSPYLVEGGIIALHDTLGKKFEGPIRVFVEDILRSDNFGPAGFSHSIGWSQYRPKDGTRFHAEREWLAQRAARLIPFVADGQEPKGLRQIRYKLCRWRVPHSELPATERLS